MRRREWANGILGNTPLEKVRLNQLEDDLGSALLQLAANPPMLFSGAVTLDAAGAPISASLTWPDGTAGIYSGVTSADFPGAIDAYTVTYAGPSTISVTQPAVTRNANGQITNSPALIIA